MAGFELNPADDGVEKKMEIDTEMPGDGETPIEVHEPSKSRCVQQKIKKKKINEK